MDRFRRHSVLDDHILTEAIPKPLPTTPHLYPNSSVFEQNAHNQSQSPLLRLPAEVRQQIYAEAWESAGLTRHIYVKDGHYTHTTCITDHEAEDERTTEVEKILHTKGKLRNGPLWTRCLTSSWANHWRCEESVQTRLKKKPAATPFLGLLLCCKRM